MHPALNKALFNSLTLPFRPFYRRYPFNSKASIRSADDRGMVDLELGFFCNRIPKAANSTVVTNLARLKFGKDVPSKQAKKMFLTPGRLSRAEVESFDSLFKFTVVREPFSRTLSAYLDKIERRALRAGKQSSFSEFLNALGKERYLYSNAHWAPQSALMLIPVEQFDYVGKVENLSADLAFIKQRIRPDVAEPVTSMKANATGAKDKLIEYYSPELIQKVRDLYRQDFEAFGYSMDFPA
jgi:hypothetical protein